MCEEAVIADSFSQLAHLVEPHLPHQWLIEAPGKHFSVVAVWQASLQIEFKVADTEEFALHRKEALLKLLLLRLSDGWLRNSTFQMLQAVIDDTVVVHATSLV